ncbi:alpha/beta fold hydrolase [Schleiferilactobacillus shenzhenensis]|uniref:Alpha/beta hydrolase n=1 Tax=Schleiferilactobacillus shenzhenensis LY-73 TaxID=1231336 RepID=U4TV65_9LACO|nr:alpha/beta fold hydrolase [Schleiferilactobacillus shenzhenensis]ERL65302.1 hypothetical protein L248_2701 [Schleiferilactobacillus shenzhenensis LY-73]
MSVKNTHRWRRAAAWTAGIIGAVAVGGTVWWQSQLNAIRHLSVSQGTVATVFIPGYNSNSWTFSPLIGRFARYGIGTDAMTINVSGNGRLTITQRAALDRRNPLINIIFADARHPEKQTAQLQTIMTTLYQQYHVRRINIVGHSMGGYLAFRYISQPPAATQPQVVRYVAIASGGARNNNDFGGFPQKLPVLAIAGDIWNTGSDWQVPLASVQHLVKEIPQAQLTVIHGSPLTAYHSALHENPQVDRRIAQFLFAAH